MGFIQQDFEQVSTFDKRPAASSGSGPITNAERYEWIRAHRGDFAITRALECSDFDCDFDRKIDTAMRASRRGSHSEPASSWWDEPAAPHRRRDDE